jgi:phage nucleotide-binding protein
MADKFVNPADKVQDQGLKTLLTGESGAGKTALAATTEAKTLLVDAEAGTMTIRNATNVKVFTVTSSEPLKQIFPVLEYLRNDNDEKFEWVVIDSISEVGEMVLAEEELKTKGIKAYGDYAKRMIPFVKAFRDLEGMNVVMTTKLRTMKDEETGVVKHFPSMPGRQVTDALPYLFDLVLPLRIMRTKAGETERWLQCVGDQNWTAKDRSGKLDRWEEPNLKNIRDKIAGKPINSKPAVKAA